MKIAGFVTKPIYLITGAAVGLFLIFRSGSSSSADNPAVELARLDRERADKQAERDYQAQMQDKAMGYNLANAQLQSTVTVSGLETNRDIRVAELMFTTDLLKTVDTNATAKTIALTESNNELASRLNAQNAALQLGLFDSQNQRDIAFKMYDTSQNIAYHLSDNELQAKLVQNETDRFLIPQQLNAQNLQAGLAYQSKVWDSVSGNYQALLASANKPKSNGGQSNIVSGANAITGVLGAATNLMRVI